MLAALEKHREVPRDQLTKSNIARFATVARGRLRNESASLRKGDRRHLVSRVEVGDREIKISPRQPCRWRTGSGAAGLPSFV
jgi:hypothetical protein